MVQNTTHNSRLDFWPECSSDTPRSYEENPRRNGDAAKAVTRSIESFSVNFPTICDGDFRVCVGHTRFKVAFEKAAATAPVLVVGDLTGEMFTGYTIADNQTGTISRWDDPVLYALVQDLEQEGVSAETLGFTPEEPVAKPGVTCRSWGTQATHRPCEEQPRSPRLGHPFPCHPTLYGWKRGGLEFFGRRACGSGLGEQMANRDDVWGLTIGVEKSEPMDSDAACRALALLTRWAIRQAEKQRSLRVKGIEEVVTVDFSKDCGVGKVEN